MRAKIKIWLIFLAWLEWPAIPFYIWHWSLPVIASLTLANGVIAGLFLGWRKKQQEYPHV